jgi:hypothetical protein
VLVDQAGLLAPGFAGIPEVTDQLLLLGIDANDRQPALREGAPLRGDVLELLVPPGAL